MLIDEYSAKWEIKARMDYALGVAEEQRLIRLARSAQKTKRWPAWFGAVIESLDAFLEWQGVLRVRLMGLDESGKTMV